MVDEDADIGTSALETNRRKNINQFESPDNQYFKQGPNAQEQQDRLSNQKTQPKKFRSVVFKSRRYTRTESTATASLFLRRAGPDRTSSPALAAHGAAGSSRTPIQVPKNQRNARSVFRRVSPLFKAS